MDVPVQARRREELANPLFCTTLRRDDESFKLAKWLILCFQEKPLSFRQQVTVPQTNSGGRAENAQAIEITLVKELGKMTP